MYKGPFVQEREEICNNSKTTPWDDVTLALFVCLMGNQTDVLQ